MSPAVLADHLQSVPPEHNDALALIFGDNSVTYGSLAMRIGQLVARWQPVAARRAGLLIDEPTQFVPAVAALDALRCHAYLVGSRDREAADMLARDLNWDAIIRDLDGMPHLERCAPARASLASAEAGLVTLLTSGTTGESKAANHTWSTLAAPVRRDHRYRDSRWLCAYPLSLYAGTQVMLQALLNWAALVVPPSINPKW